MKVLVIGGVAAGTKAAAKIKRQNRSAEVKILTQSADISYAGCGLPYYVGGMIESREELIVNTPEKYTGLTGVEVVTRCEVTSVNFQAKTVTALCQGQTWLEGYDKLVIATGATPFVRRWKAIRLRVSLRCARRMTRSLCGLTFRIGIAAAPSWWARASSVWKLRRIYRLRV